jgi:predicted DNA-binding protein YlxM (UPF0122 family)
MAGFTRLLTDDQERALVVDHEDGWKIRELSERHGVSERTVYRILAKHQAKLHNKKSRRKRKYDYSKRKLKPCGTNAAYQRHRLNGEYPCAPCLEAHTADVQASKKRVRANAGSSNDVIDGWSEGCEARAS